MKTKMIYRVKAINTDNKKVKQYWDCTTKEQAQAMLELVEDIIKLSNHDNKYVVEIEQVEKQKRVD